MFNYQIWRLTENDASFWYILVFHYCPSSYLRVLPNMAITQNAGIGIHPDILFNDRIVDVSFFVFRTSHSASLIEEESVAVFCPSHHSTKRVFCTPYLRQLDGIEQIYGMHNFVQVIHFISEV